jgi:hypothetical protein
LTDTLPVLALLTPIEEDGNNSLDPTVSVDERTLASFQTTLYDVLTFVTVTPPSAVILARAFNALSTCNAVAAKPKEAVWLPP